MDPNLKRITFGARKYMLAGLGILAVGTVGLLSSFGRADSGPMAGSGAIALCGAICMCVRFGAILDRQRRVITTWWGLLVPFHKTAHPFSQSHHVTLSREERSYKSVRYKVFPVKLEGASADTVTFYAPLNYAKARRLAEEIAKFLHLGIRDRSSGEEVVRAASTLDESIRQRAKRLRLTSRMPQQPPGARLSVSFGGSRSTATIDMPVMHWVWVVLAWLMMAGLSAVFIEMHLKLTGGPPDMARLLLTFFILLCLILPAALFIVIHERLIVSPDELVLTRRSVLGTNTIHLQANEIEEVEIMRKELGLGLVVRSIVVRSDRGSVEFGGRTRSKEEIKWLRDVLVHVLTSEI